MEKIDTLSPEIDKDIQAPLEPSMNLHEDMDNQTEFAVVQSFSQIVS